MKTITETIGGAQGLLDISFNLQGCFEEYLTDEYISFRRGYKLHPDVSDTGFPLSAAITGANVHDRTSSRYRWKK